MLAAATLGGLAALCAICSFVSAGFVGIAFRGAAAAWKTERDAAVEKAQRLDARVADQAAEIATLKAKVSDLEKRTDYEKYADRSARDHKAILDVLAELTRQMHANTVAVEFLIKQAFPTAALGSTSQEGGDS